MFKKTSLGIVLGLTLLLTGCGEEVSKAVSDAKAEVTVVVSEVDENYVMEYIFNVSNKKVGDRKYIGMLIGFDDEKMKEIFPEDVGVSNQRNESGIEYKKLDPNGETRFNKLIVVPKSTFSTLSQAQEAAEKITYKITDGEAIKSVGNS